MLRFVPNSDAFNESLELAVDSGSRVLVVDDQHLLSGVVMRVETDVLINGPAIAARERLLVDLRSATAAACKEQAQLLSRGRPFVAAFPRVISFAQAQLAVELAQRGIDVLAGAERAAFTQLVEEASVVDRILDTAIS